MIYGLPSLPSTAFALHTAQTYLTCFICCTTTTAVEFSGSWRTLCLQTLQRIGLIYRRGSGNPMEVGSKHCHTVICPSGSVQCSPPKRGPGWLSRCPPSSWQLVRSTPQTLIMTHFPLAGSSNQHRARGSVAAELPFLVASARRHPVLPAPRRVSRVGRCRHLECVPRQTHRLHRSR